PADDDPPPGGHVDELVGPGLRGAGHYPRVAAPADERVDTADRPGDVVGDDDVARRDGRAFEPADDHLFERIPLVPGVDRRGGRLTVGLDLDELAHRVAPISTTAATKRNRHGGARLLRLPGPAPFGRGCSLACTAMASLCW